MASLQLYNVWGRPGKERKREHRFWRVLVKADGLGHEKAEASRLNLGRWQSSKGSGPCASRGAEGARNQSRGECLSTPSFLWCK